MPGSACPVFVVWTRSTVLWCVHLIGGKTKFACPSPLRAVLFMQRWE